MKKRLKLIIPILAVICISVTAFCLFPSSANLNKSLIPNNITLHYNGETYTPDAEEIKTLCNIFNNKQTFFESSYCGHTSDYCIKSGYMTIMPACDGCGIMKCNFKYTNIDKKERAKLDRIFAAHFKNYRPQSYL